MASKKCPQGGQLNAENAERCDRSYQFPPHQTNATTPHTARSSKPTPEIQTAANWYIWLWISPNLTITTLWVLIGFALVNEYRVGDLQNLLPLAVLVSALWHLILLYPTLRGRTEFIRWHGRQDLLLAGARTLVALTAVLLASSGGYAFTALGVLVLIILWLAGNLWGQGQARRGDCALMRWTGHSAGLPISIEQGSPPVQPAVRPQPDAAQVDHLVDIIRFTPDPAVRRATLDELEHLGLVESL